MSTELKIRVTKEIINSPSACKRDHQNCAIAWAIRDVFPDASIGTTYIIVNANKPVIEHIRIPLPIEAIYFINCFDNTGISRRPNLPELEFTITIPDEVIETIDIESLRPLLINHPTLQLL